MLLGVMVYAGINLMVSDIPRGGQRRERESEREREKERERQRERQKETEPDRQTGRQTENMRMAH